jgi:hypothetical protein
MSTKTWKVKPLYAVMSEILDKKGSMNDMELFESLKVFYKDVGFDEFNKTLMKMELSGLVSVSSLTKGRRLVRLVKR